MKNILFVVMCNTAKRSDEAAVAPENPAQQAKSISKKTDSGVAMFSLHDQATEVNATISAVEANEIIARIDVAKRFRNSGDIRLIESLADLPAPIQKVAHQNRAGTKIKGFIHKAGLSI